MPTGPILPKCLPRKEAGKRVALCWGCCGERGLRSQSWRDTNTPPLMTLCEDCDQPTNRRVRTEDLNERGERR